MVAKQKTGPSLFAGIGNLRLEPGAVSIVSPAVGSTVATDTLTIEGTHTVPARNFDRDEAGDARPGPTSAYQPGADLRSVSLREEGDALVLSMQIADLTPAAISSAAASVTNGDGMLYLTQWDYNDTVYWLGAEVRGGSASFYTGTLGMIRSATSKKFVTYNPDLLKSQQVTGQMQGTAPGAITIRVPKIVVGSPPATAQFHTVTGHALAERGPLLPVGSDSPDGPSPAPGTTSLTPDPTSLPIMLDASGAATYTVGDGGPLNEGFVEVSIDDPNFLAPRAASLSLSGNRWTLTLAAQEITAGAHTVYARQRIDGREASPVTTTNFTISQTVERNVTSLTALTARNTSVGAGVVSWEMLISNSSAQAIFTPLSLRVARITSASGNVTVANADNGQPGAGALFDFSGVTGADGALTAGELSGARRLRFNNPSNQAFTVDFEVLGYLLRGSDGTSSSDAGSASGSGSAESSTGTTGNSSSIGGLVTGILRVTYNPLLGTVSVALVQR